MHRTRIFRKAGLWHRLEIEFHRRLRNEAPGTHDASSLHTSFALQAGYESLLRRIVGVTIEQIDQEARNLSLTKDPRDVLAARDSIAHLLGLRAFG